MPKNFKLIYKNQDATDIEEAFAKQFLYRDTVIDAKGKEIPNPQSKWDFVVDKIEEYIGDITVSYKHQVSIPPLPPTPKTSSKTTG